MISFFTICLLYTYLRLYIFYIFYQDICVYERNKSIETNMHTLRNKTLYIQMSSDYTFTFLLLKVVRFMFWPPSAALFSSEADFFVSMQSVHVHEQIQERLSRWHIHIHVVLMLLSCTFCFAWVLPQHLRIISFTTSLKKLFGKHSYECQLPRMRRTSWISVIFLWR